MKVACLEEVERIAIAYLFQYIKLEGMRAICAKCHTLLLCIFASLQLHSFTLCHFSECDDFKDETKRNNLKNSYS